MIQMHSSKQDKAAVPCSTMYTVIGRELDDFVLGPLFTQTLPRLLSSQ